MSIMNQPEMWPSVHQAFWIMSTLISWIAIIGLAAWVVGWGVRFKFWQTEEGLVVWCFSLGLLLLVINNVLGSLGSATHGWWELPEHRFEWWYFTRFGTSAFILWSIYRMLKILRRHWSTRSAINFEVPPRETKPKTGSVRTTKPQS